MDEVDVLHKVDHPNITKYFETYDDKNFLYLVMEYCPGGELFDSQEQFVKNSRGYTERDAAQIISKCLTALQHCHSLGITHRDIKPENIMYGKDKEVRLVDFGLSKESRDKMNTYAGTPYFMAPEVISENYGHKCDIWSLGCVLYMLVAGRLPFEGYTKKEVFQKITKGSYRVPNCSAPCQDLIAKMLTVDEKSRPTAAECY
jgi:calcium-dependent protein kinase